MDNKEIFKPGEWVYFMHCDFIQYGQIKAKITHEDMESKTIVYVLGESIKRAEGHVFRKKQDLLDFLMGNVENDPKS